jgi:hypothetical protein
MARDNPSWGHARIRGAIFNLGYEIAVTRLRPSTTPVALLLRDAGARFTAHETDNRRDNSPNVHRIDIVQMGLVCETRKRLGS